MCLNDTYIKYTECQTLARLGQLARFTNLTKQREAQNVHLVSYMETLISIILRKVAKINTPATILTCWNQANSCERPH